MINRRGLLRRAITACLFAAFFTPAAGAQDLNIFEPVLVPISAGTVPGAYGSIWSTDLWYRNNSDRPVIVFPLAVSDHVPTIGRTIRLQIVFGSARAPGQILYVSRDGGDKVQFDLRLFNLADTKASWGTKLPVVREHEFSDAINLINVPTSTDFRNALRIYALPEGSLDGEIVRVRIYANDERLLVDVELTLTGTPRYAAILSLADAFPEIRQVERVRVHVEPRIPGPGIWAFVSVTSNATQNVALVTPD